MKTKGAAGEDIAELRDAAAGAAKWAELRGTLLTKGGCRGSGDLKVAIAGWWDFPSAARRASPCQRSRYVVTMLGPLSAAAYSWPASAGPWPVGSPDAMRFSGVFSVRTYRPNSL